MLVGLGDGEGRPFGLQVEIDKACGAGLQDRLMERIHCAKLRKIHLVVVHWALAGSLYAAHVVHRVEPFLHSVDILLLPQSEVLFVRPDLV